MPSNALQNPDQATLILEPGLDDGGETLTGSGGDLQAARLPTSQMDAADRAGSLFQLGRSNYPVESSEAQGSNTPRSRQVNKRHDTLLQVPNSGNGGREKHTEISIWDWDTPLESVGDSSSYYFEPQGELLHEQRGQREVRGEFSVPFVVSDSDNDWPFQGTKPPAINSSFTVPRQPTGVQSTTGVKRKSQAGELPVTSNQTAKRVSRRMSGSGEEPGSPMDGKTPAPSTRSQSGSRLHSQRESEMRDDGQRQPSIDMGPTWPPVNVAGDATTRERRTVGDPGTHVPLPARKVFPIQIGDKLFRLSGTSISSDAPSYFSQFFEEQLRNAEGADSVRTLYIDRDPEIFADIALHLQGYHVEPKDGPHFVKLFADAQFYSLPRLTSQLFASTIYIRIGEEEFQIPRDLFSNPGDIPNYFSLGFAVFFTTPNDAFPGLSERTLLRPPPILPPSVPHKSAKIFADLLHVLKGYPVTVRNEEHRQELLRDARYFHLKGLEQRLIPHQLSYNLARRRHELLLRIEDLRQSGLSFVADNSTGSGFASRSSPANSNPTSAPSGPGWIYYQRPYVDSEAYSLILEIGGEENTFLSIEPGSASGTARMGRATFFKQTLARITSLFSVIASKMNLPITQPLGLMMLERAAGVASLPVSPSSTGVSEEKVKVRIGRDADVIVDGEPWIIGGQVEGDDDESAMETDASPPRTGSKRRMRGGPSEEEEDGEEWIVRKAQWRLRVQPMSNNGSRGGMEVILGAVKIEALSNERSRNAGRGFLS